MTTPRDTNIWYKYTNLGSDQVTLFIHGLGGNSMPFKKFSDALTKNGQSTLLVDLNSHGLSSKSKSKHYSIHQYTKDITEILKKENIKNINLVGHCFGGMIAINLQNQGKDYLIINKQVLISTSHKPNLSYKGHLIKGCLPLLKPLLKIFYNNYYYNKVERQSSYLNYKLNRDFSLARFSEDVVNTSVDTILSTLIEIMKSNFSKKVDKNIPTFVIHGKKDTIYDYKTALELHSFFKNSKLLIREDDNHVTHIINKNTDLPIIVSDFLFSD